MKSNCPIHTLRKEAGSKVNERFGIIAAQHFLGHASPEVTWTYYISSKPPQPTGFGELLGAALPKAPEGDNQKS